MSVILSDLGTRESRNDMLTMSVIVGTNSAMHSFRSQVGNGSSSHDFAGDSLMIFYIFTSVDIYHRYIVHSLLALEFLLLYTHSLPEP